MKWLAIFVAALIIVTLLAECVKAEELTAEKTAPLIVPSIYLAADYIDSKNKEAYFTSMISTAGLAYIVPNKQWCHYAIITASVILVSGAWASYKGVSSIEYVNSDAAAYDLFGSLNGIWLAGAWEF